VTSIWPFEQEATSLSTMLSPVPPWPFAPLAL
jgi:hypothetical protein